MSSPLPSRYVGPERIYRGGMADVYSALDRDLGRKVAIKILADRCADDEQLRATLRREAMVVARLSHVLEVVSVYDVGEWRGRPYMSMEYLGGGSLAQRLKQGRVDRTLALRWLWQAADAIDAAHDFGLVHRDVTPHNLLLDVRDNLRLSDFGIATGTDGRNGTVGSPEVIQGTGGFIAPEHLAGEPPTPAVDVYGLGAVARVLLAQATDADDRSREVQAVLSQALALRPADRYRTARDLVTALEGALVPDTAITQVFHGAATEAFQRPTRVFQPPAPESPPVVKTSPLLPVVACERLVRAVLVLAIGAAAIVLRNRPDLAAHGTTVRMDMNLNPAQHAYDRLVTPVGHSTPHDLLVLGIVALALGGLYLVEAIGLAARLRAAVYVTVVATVALIPVEIWEIQHSPGRIKEIALAVNVAVALSLLATLVHERFVARRAPHRQAEARASV